MEVILVPSGYVFFMDGYGNVIYFLYLWLFHDRDGLFLNNVIFFFFKPNLF